MKNLNLVALFASLTLPLAAQAHVDVGTYDGVTLSGEKCSFEVTESFFEDGLRHPLHERVKATVGGFQFTLSHPALIDLAENTVGFDHDHLSGTKGFAEGSYGAVLTMDHSPDNHGPKDMLFITDNYRDDGKDSSWLCSGLKLRK